MAVILVVDDEFGIRELLSEILTDEGYTVELAENASAARHAVKRHPDLILLDIWMPDNDGVSLLKEWNSTGQLTMPVIMMSGHATLDTAIEATKFGAVDFLEKPIALSRLIASVKNALEKSSKEPRIGVVRTNSFAQPTPPSSTSQHQFGSSGTTITSGTAADGMPRVIEHRNDSLISLMSAIDFNAPLREARDQFERIYFLNLLRKENSSMTRVANCAGLERTHLYRKLKQLGLEIGKSGRQRERLSDPFDTENS